MKLPVATFYRRDQKEWIQLSNRLSSIHRIEVGRINSEPHSDTFIIRLVWIDSEILHYFYNPILDTSIHESGGVL